LHPRTNESVTVRHFLLLLFVSVVLLPSRADAQGDRCQGALNALNRVKEQITPTLSADTPAGKARLEVMRSTLENGTHLCKDFPELWFYRMVVAQRLGLDKDARYAKEKVDELNYGNHFDPFSVPPAATPPPNLAAIGNARISRKWALVVGIDKFQDKRAPQLQFAAKDSRDFVNFLVDQHGGHFEPSHVIHLENEEATLKGIKEGLGRLRVEAKPDDLIVLYLSSHGSSRYVDPNGVSYIITHDTDLQDAATLYATSLQMIDLVQEINRELRARQVVLILDTCYSGDALTNPGSRGSLLVGNDDPPAGAPASSAFSPAFDNLKVGYGRAVITASRANEESWESPKLQNGYFTHYLLQVLQEGHGEARLDHVFAQVQTRVSSHVKTDFNASQNPSFEFSEHADSIVLGVPEGN
jgi:Caspase domain